MSQPAVASPGRAKALLVAALLGIGLIAAPMAPAPAASLWDRLSHRKGDKHPGTTVHGSAQHQVKPLGPNLRAVRPIGKPREVKPLGSSDKSSR
jgi:hypothetical protein